MNTPLVVSCLFGAQTVFDIYPAPSPDTYRCIFFTNREAIASRARQRGWEVCIMPVPLESDPLEAALQSKAVKYLAFWGDPFFSEIWVGCQGGLLYFDHKFHVKAEHVKGIVLRAEGAGIVLRSTPRAKMSVWDEVSAAQSQERYARNMEQTRRYMDTLIEGGLSEEVRICNTGLIYYADPAAALVLTRKVFNACTLLKQPECQIFWALYSQEHAGEIRVIDWKDPAVADITWKDPAPAQSKPAKRRSLSSRIRGKLRRILKAGA